MRKSRLEVPRRTDVAGSDHGGWVPVLHVALVVAKALATRLGRLTRGARAAFILGRVAATTSVGGGQRGLQQLGQSRWLD
jgi:hypothetical protein